jgi:hypothetical protein
MVLRRAPCNSLPGNRKGAASDRLPDDPRDIWRPSPHRFGRNVKTVTDNLAAE